MPVYEYRCESCGAEVDEFRKISESETNAPECCKNRMKIKISAVRGYVQGECHYVCPATGKQVTNWGERRNILAETGLADIRDLKAKDTIAKLKKERKDREELAAGLEIKGFDTRKHIEQFNSRKDLL